MISLCACANRAQLTATHLLGYGSHRGPFEPGQYVGYEGDVQIYVDLLQLCITRMKGKGFGKRFARFTRTSQEVKRQQFHLEAVYLEG